MYRLQSIPRRMAVLAVATLAGTAAALVFASPASAHHPTVTGTAVCDSAKGDWIVEWKVGNSEADLTGKVIGVKLTPNGTTVTNIAVDAVLPMKGQGTLNGVQRVPASQTSASLTVTAHWLRDGKDIEDKASFTVEFKGTCEQKTPKPAATFTTDCTGVVTVVLKNTGNADATFKVVGKEGFSKQVVVAGGKDATLTVPAANSGEITVTEGPQDTLVATGKRAVPGNCGNLPVTGAKAGAAAGGALALVGAGVGLFLVARRRRIRFTA